MSEMAIVIPYFNPAGYRSHLAKLRRSLDAYAAAGLAEHVYLTGAGPRPPVGCRVAFWDDACPFLWHKERLVNLAAARLPRRYGRIAWIDSDVLVGPDWADAMHTAFRDAAVVQCFTTAHYRSLDDERSRRRVGALQVGENAAIGLAWAADRTLFDTGPGLYDLGLVGGGDSIFGLGVLRPGDSPSLYWLPTHRATLAAAWSPALLATLDEWLHRARHWHGSARAAAAATDITVIEHGAVVDRSYNDRHALLETTDPARHLRATADEVYRWTADGLREVEPGVRGYFYDRQEDAGLEREPAA